MLNGRFKDLKPSAGTSDDERKVCRKACQLLEKHAYLLLILNTQRTIAPLCKQKFLPYEYTCLRESSTNLLLEDTTPLYQGI